MPYSTSGVHHVLTHHSNHDIVRPLEYKAFPLDVYKRQAVGGFGGNRLSAQAFGLNARFHFLADVLCVPLRHDIDKGLSLIHI